MAARRLLILMLVLLAVSSLAAALVPQQEGGDESASETGTTKADRGSGHDRRTPPGRLVRRTIRVAPEDAPPIKLRLGDQLALAVRSGAADQVAIPAFGQIEDVSPSAPARFNLLPDRAGVFIVRLVEAHRVIGTIKVGSPARRYAATGAGGRER